jgi:hypothetical protein
MTPPPRKKGKKNDERRETLKERGRGTKASTNEKLTQE